MREGGREGESIYMTVRTNVRRARGEVRPSADLQGRAVTGGEWSTLSDAR